MPHDSKLNAVFLIIVTLIMATIQTRAEIMDQKHDHEAIHDKQGISYGSPGDAASVNRSVEITAVDLAFFPASITVSRGETIRFIISNRGALLHELVLGTENEQIEHHSQMDAMPIDKMIEHMQNEANGIIIQPGEIEEIIWTFSTDQDHIEFACHVPGHYEAGMTGQIVINDESM